jgi:ADP-heptose:LPS heptosyltransferase
MIYHSQGVLTPISWNMHCGAAFHKPTIALAGGGEDVSWENYKYKGFHYLHTIGALECCQHGGCWKDLCTNKDNDDNRCMAMIKPEIVIDKIKKYANHR